MNNSPFFSVIIPTYNRALIVKRAIKSILDQSFQDFELIIVDDGSTDETEREVRSFVETRIIYIKLPQNSGGHHKPRNVGFANSKGKYIVMLDSDDAMDKDALATFYEWIQKRPDASSFILDSQDKKDGCMRGRLKKEAQKISSDFKLDYKTMLCTACIGDYVHCFKKEVVDKVKFPENIKKNDQAFYLEAAKNWDYLYIPKVGAYFFSEGKDRITLNIGKNAEEWIKGTDFYLQKFGKDMLELCPKRMEGWLRSRAILCILAGRRKEGLKDLFKALRYNLFSYKLWAYIVLALIYPKAISLVAAKRTR